jgi:hypothetical protein
MSDAEAILFVLRAAEANATGHQDCLKIHRAIKRVRELLNFMKK